jgi:hypothetical protein
MRPTSVKLGPFQAPNPGLLRAAASISGAGALTLLTNTVDANARRILFTSSGDDRLISFAVVGIDWNGQSVSETVTGAWGPTLTSISAYDYLMVTSIVASGASAGTVAIGTSGDASTRPVFLDPYAGANIGIYVAQLAATQNYTVEFCGGDPNKLVQGFTSSDPSALAYQNLTWVPSTNSALIAAVGSQTQTQVGILGMVRLRTTNAGNSITDTDTATFTQELNAPF